MSLASSQDKALASLQAQRTLIAPLHVQHEQHCSAEDKYVYRAITLAFPLRSDDDRTWAGLEARPELSSDTWIMQLNALLVESLCTHRIGGLQCKLSRRTDKVGYAKCVMLQARMVKFGAIKVPADRLFLSQNVTCTSKVDLEFMHDVNDAVDRIEHAQNEALKDKTKIPGQAEDASKDKDREPEDDADLLEKARHMEDSYLGFMAREAFAAAVAQPRPPEPPTESMEAALARFPFGNRSVRLAHWDSDGVASRRPGRGLMARFTAAQLLTDPPQPLRSMAANYEPVIRAHCPEAMPDAQQRAAEERMAAWQVLEDARLATERTLLDKLRRDRKDRAPYVGPSEPIDKVRMCVTAVPHADDPGRVAGLLVRFVIFDRAINPGQFLDRVLENAEQRRRSRVSLLTAAAAASSGRRDGKQSGVEMFPSYATWFAQGRHPTATSTTASDYLRHILAATNDELLRGYKGKADMRARLDYINDTPTHMYNVFGLERALGILRTAGGRVGRADDWMARGQGGGDTALYPPWCQTWKYCPESVFWADPEYVGLSEQYLPHVDTSQDFLRRLVRGDTAAELVRAIGATRPERAREREQDRAFTPAELYMRNEPRVERKRVAARSASVNYETTNPLVHAAADASYAYERLRGLYPSHYPTTIVEVQLRVAACAGAWRSPGEAVEGIWRERPVEQLSPAERAHWDRFMARVAECEAYNAIVRETQRVLLGTYEGLLPLSGDIESTSLSEPIQAILCWYRDCHETKLPHVTRAFVWKDREMDPFGLTQLEHAGILVKFARILQPMVCMLSEGLFSCYDHFLDELSFHLILHGIHDTGKSFTGIHTLIKYICIPGTVSEVSQASKRAGTSRRHTYDLINAR